MIGGLWLFSKKLNVGKMNDLPASPRLPQQARVLRASGPLAHKKQMFEGSIRADEQIAA